MGLDAGRAATLATVAIAAAWGAVFAYLAVVRHLAGGSHAEDLGFTDQVMWNFLHGKWFRMSIYPGATWYTEIDVAHIARPDSLLAFHFEPMLLVLVPIYALAGGMIGLLVLQAVAVAAGAVPAYRLGRHLTGSALAGVSLAAAYLLSPFGQWAVLADFHTSTLAAPLLLLAVERLVVARALLQAIVAAAAAATAREDVALAVTALGATIPLLRLHSRAGLAIAATGLGVTGLGALVIHSYSGGASPFDVRYGPTLGGGIQTALAALGRPLVAGYGLDLLASGAWLGLLSPIALLAPLPAIALNALSASPWMAAGRAHYSGVVLPLLMIAVALGLGRLKARNRMLAVATAALVLTSAAVHVSDGAGPLGGNFAPASLTEHAAAAASVARSLPADAAVSASTSLVPRGSARPRVYVFPAVEDADYVFLDLQATPAPISAGDVFLHVKDLLAGGGWTVISATDGLLVLHRVPGAPPASAADLGNVASVVDTLDMQPVAPVESFGDLSLLSTSLQPSREGAVDVDGPRGVLRTVWRAEHAVPAGTRLDLWLDLHNGQQMRLWDIPTQWWDPPERWRPGESVTVDFADIPLRQVESWRLTVSGP